MLCSRSRVFAAVGIPLFVMVSSGCDRLPRLEHTPEASPNQIAVRVQCELATALEPYLPHRKQAGHPWLNGWTAQFDLTLAVTETSGLATAISFNDPFTPAVLPGIGTFGQAFTFGFNAGLSSTATRNEQLSFSVRLNELDDHKKRLECPREDRRNLDANLGMSEWLDKVFHPIAEQNIVGGAPKPKAPKARSVAKPAAPPPPPGFSMLLALKQESNAQTLENEIDDQVALKGPIPNCETKDSEGKPIKAPGGVELHRDKAMDAFRCFALTFLPADEIAPAPKAPKNPQVARNWAKLTDKIVDAVQNIHGKELQKTFSKRKDFERFATDGTLLSDPALFEPKDEDAKRSIISQYYTSLAATLASINAYLEPKQPAPLDVIVHQVNFVVLASGSLSPNWNLVRFKGPNNSGPAFTSASRSRTHGLVITLGDPNNDAAKNARASASISSALKNSGVVITP